MKNLGQLIHIFFLGVLLLAPASALQAQFTFTTNNNTITITGYTGASNVVIIPGTTNGLSVTSIGNGAFSASTTLANITFPASITNIGADAFAFCSSLTNVTLGTGVITIGDYAFAYSSLTNATLPAGVISLGVYAFSGSSLVSMAIPAGVTNIGDDAFADCTNLTAVTVNAANTHYSSTGGVLFTVGQTVLIQYPPGNATASYTIPNTVTNVGDNAFASSILASLTFSNNVASIGANAFYGCSRLTNITVSTANTNYSSSNGVLFNKNGTTLIQYPSGNTAANYTIPSGVIGIGTYAFALCPLARVTIPNSVTSIGTDAFNNCSKLASVTLGNGVNSIGVAAFQDCTSLTNLVIPSSVDSIGDYAFDYCLNLTGAYFQGNAPSGDATVFNSDTATVYYLPGTTGWGATFGSLTTALWSLPYPLILNTGASFGLHANQFEFTVSWATNLAIVIQACTNLVNPVWTPVSTNVLSSGATFFSDAKWTNYHSRYYRISGP